MIAVSDAINPPTLEKCATCGDALVPTPDGYYACAKGHGRLRPLGSDSASRQRLGLIVTGEVAPEFFGERAVELAADSSWIRSLPTAVKSKHKGRVVWIIGGKMHKRRESLTARRIKEPDEVFAIVTPKTVMRVGVFVEIKP